MIHFAEVRACECVGAYACGVEPEIGNPDNAEGRKRAFLSTYVNIPRTNLAPVCYCVRVSVCVRAASLFFSLRSYCILCFHISETSAVLRTTSRVFLCSLRIVRCV